MQHDQNTVRNVVMWQASGSTSEIDFKVIKNVFAMPAPTNYWT